MVCIVSSDNALFPPFQHPAAHKPQAWGWAGLVLRQSVPSQGCYNSVAGAKSCTLSRWTLWVSVGPVMHDLALYCLCYLLYPLSSVCDICECPKYLLVSVFFCQGCWGTCWTTAVSRMCSPKLLGVVIFLLLAQTSEKKEDFHPSEFPVIPVLLTDKVVSNSVQVARVLHSGSKSFHPACGFCCGIQCYSFIIFTELNYPEAGWQYAVQQTHLWLQTRDCLLHQVECCSSWSRYILVVCFLYSLVFCTEREIAIFLLGKILRVRWMHLFMFSCYELSCHTFSARNQVNYLNYERIILRFYW